MANPPNSPLEPKLAHAISIAADAHIGQFDKGGETYILHSLAVMHKVRSHGRIAMICAVLHDVEEDTDAYIDYKFFPGEVEHVIDLLTHKHGENYFDYIARVATHPIARVVKLADLEHNMEIGRLPMGDVGEKDYQRWDKYRRAVTYLKEADL